MFKKNYKNDYQPACPVNEDISSFIPVVGHISKETLICRDGELVQNIIIDGYNGLKLETYEEILSLRKELRSAILDIVQDDKIAIYVQTIRSRRNITPGGVEPHGFSDELNRKWTSLNNWDKQLCNTLFISVVRQSPPIKATSIGDFLNTLFYPIMKYRFKNSCDVDEQKLTTVTNKLTERLEKFGARKLSLKDTPDGYISENLELYHQIIHMSQKNIVAPIRDYANYLAHTQIKYHFNSLEIGEEHDRSLRHAAIYSIKDLCEVNVEKMDELLHMGAEFIITQIFMFVPSGAAKKHYDHIHKIISYGKDADLLNESGHSEFFSSDEGFSNDYCKIFTSVMVYADSKEFFNEKVKQLVKRFNDLGLVAVREDFWMASVYWAQLPGNFRFIPHNRMHYLNTSRSCHFASLINHESGNYIGSKWGSPLTLLRSVKGTPFYLNYHNRNGLGNTLMVGPIGSGKTILSRFLIAQSFKYSPRVINIDVDADSKEFFETFGGTNLKISQNQASDILINPFNPQLFGDDREQYRTWLHRSIYPSTVNLPQFVEFFSLIVDHLLTADSDISRYEIVKAAIESTDDQLMKQGFQSFFDKNEFNHIFAEFDENLAKLTNNKIVNIDVSDLLSSPLIFESYIGILLEKTISLLDGEPTIIIVNNLTRIMGCQHFATKFSDWLQKINLRNAVALINMNRDEELEKSPLFQKSLKYFGSFMFLSDKFADKYFRRNFGLTERELNNIKSYEKKRHIFLFKQDTTSVSLQLNLAGLDDELKVLSSGGIK